MNSICAGFIKAILEKYVDPLLKKTIEFSKEGWEKFKIDFDLAFTSYLGNALKKYSRIKTILYRTEPRYIYDFFEVPFLKKEQNKIIKADKVNNLLEVSHHIIIQGIGGTGKSTLMKHLFINELDNHNLIPVFLELKDINDFSSEFDFEDIVFNKLINLGSSLDRRYLDYALKSGVFLFFLDGYDEILTEKKNCFFKKLDAFIDKYSDNYYIISSRPYSEFIEFQRFTVLTICPLNKNQAVSLVKKIEFDEEIKKRFIDALDVNLFQTHESFASNPLLLNIMLLTFDNYAEIPEKLHLFYSNAFETMYSKHDATKAGYKREIKSKLPYDSFRSVFSYFCFISYAQSKIEFSYDDIVMNLKRIPVEKYAFEIDKFIYDLINSVCVLYKDGLNFKFVHRSFQEYFTAVFLKELPDDFMQQMGFRLIKKDVFRATHDSVFNMLYDMAQERFEQNILLPLLKDFENDVENNERYDFYFRKLVRALKYDKFPGETKLSLMLGLYSGHKKDDIVAFFYNFLRFYSNDENEKEIDLASDRLRKYLFKHRYKIDKDINGLDILKDQKLYELVKDTWIGHRVKLLSELSATLYAKQEKIEIDLSNLLTV